MSTIVTTENDAGVLTLTLNRPSELNAFTPEMAEELETAFDLAAEDEAVRAVVVTGSGRAFCAGMDLSGTGNAFGLDESAEPNLDDLRARPEASEYRRGVRDLGGLVALAILRCPKPVIAAINGPAIGVGATITLPMDARLVSTDGRFGFVFGKIGIVPESCASWFLPRIVGVPQALDLVYTGDVIDPERALSIGLARSVHAPGELIDAAHQLAHRFVDGRSAAATAMTRSMIYRHLYNTSPFEAHLVESMAIFHASQNDGKEGVEAFREKRRPQFSSTADFLVSTVRRGRRPGGLS
ncbi:enoyl-CoA hydratase-related protein [Microbacterium sp. A84]|uniref:enoyl-CoA hydratase-related protein n=1 Tax=Microbacterium sp. A84 TaxID=3450715 RepID=UPI003F421519